jgi:hypothetical protein
MMHLVFKTLILLTLVACSGCGRASMIDARRDHILAGPHGWIDITLHAPTPAVPLAAANAAGERPTCTMTLRINGEAQFDAAGDLAQADAANNPLGYRFVAPAGTLQSELTIAGCVPATVRVALPVTLEKDHLALLEFDGHHLSATSSVPYAPASLDAIHGEMALLGDGARTTDSALSRLTWLAIAGVLLNIVVIVVASRRRKQA